MPLCCRMRQFLFLQNDGIEESPIDRVIVEYCSATLDKSGSGLDMNNGETKFQR